MDIYVSVDPTRVAVRPVFSQVSREPELLELDVPGGWSDVSRWSQKVLSAYNQYWVLSGWNSDRGVAYFKPATTEIATIVGNADIR